MKGIPIFYFHSGFSYYLQYTINQTKKWNPDSNIYFLGDESNKKVEQWGIRHVMYVDYFDLAKRMAENYVHLNSNSKVIELLCMQRWLCVAGYTEKNELNGPFVLLDSDVLLYTDISEYVTNYMGSADMSVCGEYCGPGYVIFKDWTIAKKLALGLLSWYENDEKKKKLYEIRDELIELGNPANVINDVKLLELVCNENQFEMHDMTRIIDKKRFDTHIARAEDSFPLTRQGIKDVHMVKGIPYCIDVLTNEDIRFLSLHFQGGHKIRMYKYYTGDKRLVQSNFIGYNRMIYQKLKKKVFSILKKIK